MADKARHAFGSSDKVSEALANNLIDAYDILFLDGDTEPKVGWVDKEGVVRIVENSVDVDLSGIEAKIATKADIKDVTQLETEVATKANIEDVKNSYEKIKYEISDVPVGTLIDYREDEIRICCATDTAWTKQAVGTGGDPNSYYMTFKTYCYNDDVVGYREYINGQFDAETLTDLKTDKYGRKYQPTWLSVANYDAETDTWSYRGAESTSGGYVGWDYRIDFYNADDVVIESNSIRINLSNENCHSSIEPYYVGSMMKEVDAKIAKIAEASSYEIIEF